MGFLPRPARAAQVRDRLVHDLLELLAPLGGVTARPMFGGHGLFCDDRMFALVSGGSVYVKADALTKSQYEEQGMLPFRPDNVQVRMSYYLIPATALEDPEQLRQWAREGMDAALRVALG